MLLIQNNDAPLKENDVVFRIPTNIFMKNKISSNINFKSSNFKNTHKYLFVNKYIENTREEIPNK